METIVGELVQHGFQNPHLIELLRLVPFPVAASLQWHEKRQEMTQLIESIIRRGIERGEFCDPHPDLTAQFVREWSAP